MYGFIWRHLPGGRLAKTVQALILIAIVVALCWYVLFPWLEPRLPFNNVTVG